MYINDESRSTCPYKEIFRKGICRADWENRISVLWRSVSLLVFTINMRDRDGRNVEIWKKWCYKYFWGKKNVLEMTVLVFMLIDTNLERTILFQCFKWAIMLILPPLLFSEPGFLTLLSHRKTAMSNPVSWKPSKQNLCQNVGFGQYFLLSYLSLTPSWYFFVHSYFLFSVLKWKKKIVIEENKRKSSF